MLDRAAELGKDLSTYQLAPGVRRGTVPFVAREYAGPRRLHFSMLRNGESASSPMNSRATTARHPGMVVNESIIVEIVRPGTGDPVPDGEVGELVVTSFNPAYPLIRFGTGDLSAIIPAFPPAAVPTRA